MNLEQLETSAYALALITVVMIYLDCLQKLI